MLLQGARLVPAEHHGLDEAAAELERAILQGEPRLRDIFIGLTALSSGLVDHSLLL